MLEIANLEVVYHSVVLVLRGVSLRVPEGKIVALLGPNGAGKTTALRAITGLLPLHDGKITKGLITLDGESLRRSRADQIVAAGVSQVMEGRRVFADLSVDENLMCGANHRPRIEARRDADAFYERFPMLAERREAQAGYLSGGEQQILAIARALMGKPRLLLLDEPSLGLAPKIVREVAALIREINSEEHVSILLVEQNATLALELSDYGYVLENGKIVIDGPSEELKGDQDVQEFYLGVGDKQESYRDVKLYRRRKRWLS